MIREHYEKTKKNIGELRKEAEFARRVINDEVKEKKIEKTVGIQYVDYFLDDLKEGEKWGRWIDILLKIADSNDELREGYERQYKRADENGMEITRKSSEISSTRSELEIVKVANLSLQKQLKDKDEAIEWGKRELTKTQNDRDDYKNKWVVSEKDLNDLRQLFNNLKLENTKKRGRNRRKEKWN